MLSSSQFSFLFFSLTDIIAQSRAHINCHIDLMTQIRSVKMWLCVSQGVKWEIFRSIRDTCECPAVVHSHLIFLSWFQYFFIPAPSTPINVCYYNISCCQKDKASCTHTDIHNDYILNSKGVTIFCYTHMYEVWRCREIGI